MQEVCSALDGHSALVAGAGALIKSEPTLLSGGVGNNMLLASPNTPSIQQPQQQQSPQQVTKLMAAVAAAAAVNNSGGGNNNCDKRLVDNTAAATYWAMGGGNGGGGGVSVSAESGFINSQPSMAEFLTHLGPDSPKLGGVLSGGHQQQQLQQQQQQGYGSVTPPDGLDGVPEYPWMKEKKTARKGSSSVSQGDLGKYKSKRDLHLYEYIQLVRR